MATHAHFADDDTTQAESRDKRGHGGAIAGAAIAGAVIALAANMGRKAAMQAPTVMAKDWVEGLTREHQMVLGLFDKIIATSDRDTAKRTALLLKLKQALTKHALEEENVVYPSLRRAGEGNAADELYREHAQVKQYLFELGSLRKDSPDWLPKVKRFREEISAHMEEEEQNLFPRLRAQLGADGNKELARMMNTEGFIAA